MAKANVANTLVVPTETTVFPYYDDFNEDKNFYRVLFRPGYAVQARELTQLQTILQNQIERFGRHVFENGSMVIGGEVYIPDSSYDTINLSPIFANTAVDVTAFENKLIVSTDAANTTQFRVIKVEPGNSENPPVLYGRYISLPIFDDNTTFTIRNENVFANTALQNNYTKSSYAGIRDSIFFYNGFFVKVPSQTTVIGKYTVTPTCRIGLELNDDIVTEQSDSSLLDPAQESFNYQAPGASRYKIDLNLRTRSLESEDDSKFIELARVENGSVQKIVKYPIYSEIEEVLARRTYDESGNYIVKPFNITLNESQSNSSTELTAHLSPGKGYIYGYETETVGTTKLQVKKGKTLVKVDAYDLNANYGNYVIVNKMRGAFDIPAMEGFDIHCVPWANVDFSTAQTYNRTKIGTGRVKDIEFFSGDVDETQRKYEFYIFNTNFINIQSSIATSDGNRTVYLFNEELLSTENRAYDGAVLNITSGAGSGYKYIVDSYNTGGLQEFTLTTPLFEQVDANTQVSLEFSFVNAECFGKSNLYTTGATSTAHADVDLLNKSGRSANGSTFISENSLGTLIFPLPESYIAYGANGITNASYSYRKKYTTSFTAGVSTPISAATNENFIGTTASSNIASTILNNFLVVVTDPGSSARRNNSIISVTTDVTGSPEQVTFYTGNTHPDDTFSATVFAKMEFDPGVVPRQKVLHVANYQNLSTNSYTELTNTQTGSLSKIYLPDGQIIIENPTRQAGVSESLYISDVSYVKIYNLNGQTLNGGDDITQYEDVTSRYELDTGQREEYYDHASIKLKPEYAPPYGPLLVCCRYYEHLNISAQGGGYFSVDSYPNLDQKISEGNQILGDGYSIIPQFVRQNGTILELRDCIDFRTSRQNASNASNFTLTNSKIALPTTDFELDYEYYLGRRDLIVLNKNRTFGVIEGIPSKFPQEPSVPATSMVLYSLNIPPYTEYASNVSVKAIDNKRYTMRDIGKIEKRVESLEYYVALNTLEKNALDITIPDVDGIDRTKYGVFVDSFTNHNLGNPKLLDYKCAMNFKEGWLQNQQETVGIKLIANTQSSVNVSVTRDKILLNYIETEFLSQKSATKFSPVADFLYAGFEGNIMMSPEADIWYSTQQRPDIVITDNSISLDIEDVYNSIVNSSLR